MTPPSSFASVWLKQARNDLQFARAGLEDGFFAQACFLAQQAAEKAAKAVVLSRNQSFPFTHSLTELCRTLGINGKLLQAAAVLDLYYVAGRYPSGAGSLAPYELLTREQAVEALSVAARFLKVAAAALAPKRRRRRR